MITIDLEKARTITKQRLRTQRAAVFSVLDIQFQRNLEISADNTAVVAAKQKLRDITKLADSANSIDELKAIVIPS